MGTIAVSAREAIGAQALVRGMIACIDDASGRVLDSLAEAGLADDTVLLFTADHGDHLGNHRLLLKGSEQYQALLRVPMTWPDPKQSSHPASSEAIASSIDIAAIIIERTRVGSFNSLQGQSLLAVLSGESDSHRETAFVQYYHQRVGPGIDRPPRVHTLVGARWRLSLYDGGEWDELYDLTSDLGEFDDL